MDKDTFKKESQEKIDLLSAKIDELQKKLESATVDIRKETKIAGEKSLVELKELRSRMQVHVDELQKVAEAKWEEAMKEFDEISNEIVGKANSKINQIWEKLKRFFES